MFLLNCESTADIEYYSLNPTDRIVEMGMTRIDDVDRRMDLKLREITRGPLGFKIQKLVAELVNLE